MFFGFPVPDRESRRVAELRSPDRDGRTPRRIRLDRGLRKMRGRCRPAAACRPKADAGKRFRNRLIRLFPTSAEHVAAGQPPARAGFRDRMRRCRELYATAAIDRFETPPPIARES